MALLNIARHGQLMTNQLKLLEKLYLTNIFAAMAHVLNSFLTKALNLITNFVLNFANYFKLNITLLLLTVLKLTQPQKCSIKP